MIYSSYFFIFSTFISCWIKLWRKVPLSAPTFVSINYAFLYKTVESHSTSRSRRDLFVLSQIMRCCFALSSSDLVLFSFLTSYSTTTFLKKRTYKKTAKKIKIKLITHKLNIFHINARLKCAAVARSMLAIQLASNYQLPLLTRLGYLDHFEYANNTPF